MNQPIHAQIIIIKTEDTEHTLLSTASNRGVACIVYFCHGNSSHVGVKAPHTDLDSKMAAISKQCNTSILVYAGLET